MLPAASTAQDDLLPIRVRDWRTVYAGRLAVTDLLVLIWVVFGVQIAWFGFDTTAVSFRGNRMDLGLSYTAVSVLLILIWMAMLSVFGTRGHRVLGTGPNEYRLIGHASVQLFGLLAMAAYLLQIDIARGYILLAFPLGTVMLVFSRWLWRQWLRVKRREGKFCSTVLLVGSISSADHLAQELSGRSEIGYRVVAACTPSGLAKTHLPATGIRVFGDLTSVKEALASTGADTVIITSSDDLSPQRVREISWILEPGRQHLVVAPSLTDIGGPRIHTRPVAGLPLIHVETPTYEGRKQFAKRAFDILVSGGLILVLSVPLLIIGLLVFVTSQGPVFYRQSRVGLLGRDFYMLKFRSMVVNADDQLAGLLDSQGTNDRPLFKIHQDPRLTRIGGFLRKHSLDEFPQLLNVLLGDMSLVGPRPQRNAEVALYEPSEHRRLFVKPGMSGLWQVSGRSALSWEDSIRLDLYYVENWSMAGDLVILWRTIKAVLIPGDQAS